MYHFGILASCVLSCLSPSRAWWRTSLEGGSGGLISASKALTQSEKSPKWTKHSYCLNTTFSYLVSPISTRRGFRRTCCCYFTLLFSCLVLCLFQAGWDPDQGQSKQIREEQTNSAEPLPKVPVDLKTIYVPGEVGGGCRGTNTHMPPAFTDLAWICSFNSHSLRIYGTLGSNPGRKRKMPCPWPQGWSLKTQVWCPAD